MQDDEEEVMIDPNDPSTFPEGFIISRNNDTNDRPLATMGQSPATPAPKVPVWSRQTQPATTLRSLHRQWQSCPTAKGTRLGQPSPKGTEPKAQTGPQTPPSGDLAWPKTQPARRRPGRHFPRPQDRSCTSLEPASDPPENYGGHGQARRTKPTNSLPGQAPGRSPPLGDFRENDICRFLSQTSHWAQGPRKTSYRKNLRPIVLHLRPLQLHILLDLVR